MNFKAHITLVFAMLTFSLQAQTYVKKFDKSVYFDVMASEDIAKVEAQLRLLQELEIPEKEAYEGALLMKKAGLSSGAKEKLSLFKTGHKKLEKAISNHNENTEFRFLRLIIQENAPRILNYKDDMNEDSQHITKFFKSLSPTVQQAIINYSKKSKVIKV